MTPNLFVQSKFIEIPIAATDEQLRDLAGSYELFLDALPRHELEALVVPSNALNGTPEGYSDTRGIPGKDLKQYFHFEPNAIRDCKTVHSLYSRSPVAQHFLDSTNVLYQLAINAGHYFVCEHLPEYKERLFATSLDDGVAARLASLRSLKYDSPTARAHYDKAFITIHIWQNAPGLQIGCCEKTMSSIRHRESVATVFPGLQFYECTGVAPAWHKVVNDKPDSRRYDNKRIVFVLFLSLPDVPFANKEATHTNICDIHGHGRPS